MLAYKLVIYVVLQLGAVISATATKQGAYNRTQEVCLSRRLFAGFIATHIHTLPELFHGYKLPRSQTKSPMNAMTTTTSMHAITTTACMHAMTAINSMHSMTGMTRLDGFSTYQQRAMCALQCEAGALHAGRCCCCLLSTVAPFCCIAHMHVCVHVLSCRAWVPSLQSCLPLTRCWTTCWQGGLPQATATACNTSCSYCL